MTQVQPPSAIRISTGSFQIESDSDELNVTRVSSAWKSSRLAVFASFVGYGMIFVCAACALVFIASQYLSLLVVAAGLLLIAYFLDVRNSLRCTRDHIEVTDSFNGVFKAKMAFPKDRVSRIGFSEVSFSKYGVTCGLTFESSGKQVLTLRGLKCPEAHKILDELRRLGYDVVQDPYMPRVAA